jgi:hypothetical protein
MRHARVATGVSGPRVDIVDWVGRIPVRLKGLSKDIQEAQEQLVSAPTIEQRLDDLVTFYNEYEGLVETICDSAQYGPEPKLQKRYERTRAWMLDNYPNLRRYVTAYLRYDVSDSQQILNLHGSGGDAFEALFTAPTLAEFLRCDDGMMISRIMRTRDALSQYGDHLRQLEGRK